MKMINNQRVIKYFGLSLVIDAQSEFIATDKDGYVWSYTIKPHKEEDHWFTMYGRCQELCKVDLEGIDWEDTLVCLS